MGKFNDLDLSGTRWKDLDHIDTSSLWIIPSWDDSNGAEHTLHGSFVPQIPRHFIERFTKRGEVVLDLFLGSATTAVEAAALGRRCVGVDLDAALITRARDLFEGAFLIADSCILGSATPIAATMQAAFGTREAHLTLLHPPYWNIIPFSDHHADLSRMPTKEDFCAAFGECTHLAFHLTAAGRYAALVIGDAYREGRFLPISQWCFSAMEAAGWIPVAEIIKNITGNETGKGKNTNLWRYRHLKNGSYGFDHEHIFVFRKEPK